MAGHEVKLAVIGFCRPENAVGLVRLDNGDDWALFISVQGSKISADCAGHGANARLKEDVGGLQAFELACRLCSHGGISLHDPAGDLFISIPGGILYQHPPIPVLPFSGQPDSIVVIEICD